MSISQKHHGVVVPLVTPFDENGRIDTRGAEELCERLAAAGIGIFVLGTTGEASSIPLQDRRSLVEIALKTADKRVLVYAGIGDNSLQNSVTCGRDYLAMGVDAVVAHLPSYYLIEASDMRSYFMRLAKDVGRDVMLYNMPQTTRMSIPLDLVEELSHQPEIIGYKDSENVAGRPEECAARFAAREDFSIFMGVALLSSKALRLGFRGLVPSSGNIAPAFWADLYAAALKKDWARVDALQTRVDAIAQVFQRGRPLAQQLGVLKACLSTLGVCGHHMLPPLPEFPKEKHHLIADELRPLLENPVS